MKIERSEYNRYKPFRLFAKHAACSLLDGLIFFGTLGRYRGYYAIDASTEILRYAMEVRKAERRSKAIRELFDLK